MGCFIPSLICSVFFSYIAWANPIERRSKYFLHILSSRSYIDWPSLSSHQLFFAKHVQSLRAICRCCILPSKQWLSCHQTRLYIGCLPFGSGCNHEYHYRISEVSYSSLLHLYHTPFRVILCINETILHIGFTDKGPCFLSIPFWAESISKPFFPFHARTSPSSPHQGSPFATQHRIPGPHIPPYSRTIPTSFFPTHLKNPTNTHFPAAVQQTRQAT